MKSAYIAIEMGRFFLFAFAFLTLSPALALAAVYDLSNPSNYPGASPHDPYLTMYEYTIDQIKTGDVIEFKHDKNIVQFHIKRNIGHGGQTNVFLLENGKALKINYKPYGDYIVSYVSGQRAFKRGGTPVVGIYEDETYVSPDIGACASYAVMNFLDFKVGGHELSLLKFLPIVENGPESADFSKLGLTRAQGLHMIERLKDFAGTLSRFTEAFDFLDTNIAFIPSQDRWVIFDFQGEPAEINRSIKAVQPTLIDDQIDTEGSKTTRWQNFEHNKIYIMMKNQIYKMRYYQFPEVAGCHALEFI